jgi:hypothetical protein
MRGNEHVYLQEERLQSDLHQAVLDLEMANLRAKRLGELV